MEDVTHIELSDLYDLLAEQTNRYMKMLSEGATKQEFNQCRERSYPSRLRSNQERTKGLRPGILNQLPLSAAI